MVPGLENDEFIRTIDADDTFTASAPRGDDDVEGDWNDEDDEDFDDFADDENDLHDIIVEENIPDPDDDDHLPDDDDQ